MRARRGRAADDCDPRTFCSGPAKLTQALAIGREQNGLPAWREPLVVTSRAAVGHTGETGTSDPGWPGDAGLPGVAGVSRIVSTPRIGSRGRPLAVALRRRRQPLPLATARPQGAPTGWPEPDKPRSRSRQGAPAELTRQSSLPPSARASTRVPAPSITRIAPSVDGVRTPPCCARTLALPCPGSCPAPCGGRATAAASTGPVDVLWSRRQCLRAGVRGECHCRRDPHSWLTGSAQSSCSRLRYLSLRQGIGVGACLGAAVAHK